MTKHQQPERWLSAADFSLHSGISARKARKALSRGMWRGATLVVRQRRGQGGRSGLHYEVLVSSLPLAIQERFIEEPEASSLVLRSDADANTLRSWLFALIEPALAHPKHSRERGEYVRAIAGRTHVAPNGRTVRLSERTLQRLVGRFEHDGAAGLQGRTRADRGQRRVVISRQWHKAVPFDAAIKEAIATRATEHVRALWRSGVVLSMVIRSGSEWLMKATQNAGFDPGPRKLRRICELPRRFVEPHKHLRKVHRYERDRKAHEDAKPRIRRTRDGLDPMEVLVGDVHHLDIYVAREDGTLATPKMIAWYDFATTRIFATFLLCPAGESVRNEHVIASFVAMVRHPEWGMPRILYLDNGSEYNFAPFISDALKLVSPNGLQRVEPIIHAKPYNASAKAIEGVFGLLERNYFSQLPGWIGGDRMRTKTANVGRAPAPFNGSMTVLEQNLRAYLTLYESQPQRGELKGLSPGEAFKAAVGAGWQRTDIDPFALHVAFSTEESRVVKQGAISVGGKRWTCAELQSYLGDQVSVLIPKFEDWPRLPLKDDRGRLLGFAVPDTPYYVLDPEGARESARRSGRYEKAMRMAGRAVPRADLVGEAIASARLAPPVPVPPSAGIITLNNDAAAIGRAIAETPARRRARQQAAIEAEQEDEKAVSARMLERARDADKRRKAG